MQKFNFLKWSFLFDEFIKIAILIKTNYYYKVLNQNN